MSQYTMEHNYLLRWLSKDLFEFHGIHLNLRGPVNEVREKNDKTKYIIITQGYLKK